MSSEKEIKPLLARVPADLHRRLRICSYDEGKSMSRAITEAIEEYLARREGDGLVTSQIADEIEERFLQ